MLHALDAESERELALAENKYNDVVADAVEALFVWYFVSFFPNVVTSCISKT